MTAIALVPAFSSIDDLRLMLARLAPYVAAVQPRPEVHCVVVDGSPAAAATAEDLVTAPPAFLGSWVCESLPDMLAGLVRHPHSAGADWMAVLEPGDLLLVQDAGLVRHATPTDKALLNGHAARGVRLGIIDPALNPYASMDLARWIRPWAAGTPAGEWAKAYTVLKWLHAAADGRGPEGESRVLALGAGPSLRDAAPWARAAPTPGTPALLGNGLIQDQNVLARLSGPLLACVMDIQFMGPSRMADRYTTGLERFLAEGSERWVATSIWCAPLLRARLSETAGERVIAIALEPLANPPQPFKLDVFRHRALLDAWNVSTTLTLPLATSLARSVVIGGLDGRPPNRTDGLWDSITYREAEDSVRQAFGRLPGEDDPAYYALHQGNLTAILDQMVGGGWKVTSMAPSHYPAVNAFYTPEG